VKKNRQLQITAEENDENGR